MADSKGIAVVTGAGTGIGKASALAFLKDGWSCVLAGRRADMLERVVVESGAGKRALAAPTDVSKPAEVKALFQKTVATFGRVDVVFNNAGGNAPGVAFEGLTHEKWLEVVNVNLNGMFYCAQEAFRIMKDQDPRGGRIINNGSISAHAPRPDSAPYTATKHAATGLTKTLSLDGRKYDIACCQIDVGNAVTPLTERMAQGVRQANGEMKPEPRMPVEYVGQAVLFMSNLPLDVNVQFMTIMATKMPFVGRG
ncbi:MAG: SDR family oxidoreductase [Burkholderiales bacterium]|nr:SDR family oxidoreductase [Burkholderiales bacterium]